MPAISTLSDLNMLKLLRTIFRRNQNTDAGKALDEQHRPAPTELLFPGVDQGFSLGANLNMHRGFPMLDWKAVQRWVDRIESEEDRAKAWACAEQAWLLHLRESLGEKYSLTQSETAALLSPLEKKVAHATLEYMTRTLKRITNVLDGMADVSPWDLDILIVFESEEQYYDYVSYYYSDEGEFAFSSGMFISEGCSHFVTVQSDLRAAERIIAHEMTHACLSHLPIPLWLNEGLAVNTEQRLTGRPPCIYSPLEMREKHVAFWGVKEIQEFWSGESFSRTDDGNMLSYDLARILVEQFSKDWSRFKEFVLAANWQDAGAEAAQRHLDIKLGECVAALLEKSDYAGLEPSIEKVADPQNAAYAHSLSDTEAPAH